MMAGKEKSRLSEKIDRICKVVFLTEEGKPKSPTLVYSFSLSLLFIAVVLVSYLFLLEPLERAFAESSVALRNVVEYSVPALAACIPCVALSFAFREKMNIVPAAFTWMCIIALIMVVTMVFIVDRSDWKTEYALFMAIAGAPMIMSSVIGALASQIVFRRRLAARDMRLEKYSSRR